MIPTAVTFVESDAFNRARRQSGERRTLMRWRRCHSRVPERSSPAGAEGAAAYLAKTSPRVSGALLPFRGAFQRGTCRGGNTAQERGHLARRSLHDTIAANGTNTPFWYIRSWKRQFVINHISNRLNETKRK